MREGEGCGKRPFSAGRRPRGRWLIPPNSPGFSDLGTSYAKSKVSANSNPLPSRLRASMHMASHDGIS